MEIQNITVDQITLEELKDAIERLKNRKVEKQLAQII